MSLTPSPRGESATSAVLMFLAFLAVAVPALLAHHVPPSVTFLNQAVSLAGWGLLSASICVLVQRTPGTLLTWQSGPAIGALFLMGASVMFAQAHFGLPMPLAASSLGFIGAAMLALVMGALSSALPNGRQVFTAFCVALVLAGIGSLGVAVVQTFFPAAAEGEWIAKLATPGRAGGNLRQPNHLSSLLLLSIAALVWLLNECESRWAPDARTAARLVAATLLAGFVLGVVLTVSRTGAVCIVLLAAWGLVDKRLSPWSRTMLRLLPVVYSVCWLGVSALADAGAYTFSGGSQLQKSDPSSSRFGIWANAWSLLMQNPWAGVGWGEFNFAWTLTPFPGRPGAFFDHTHNLPLQLLVELGIPLGGTVLALVLWAVWSALKACVSAEGKPRSAVRTAFVMVLMMAVHSQLEYPLWYAYFLLPTAFAFGVCLGSTPSGEDRAPAGVRVNPLILGVLSVVLVVGSVYSVVDYTRVSAIFVPPENAPPLDQRIATGRRSAFFGHHADYAAATTAAKPSEAMSAFDRAPHYLLDTRLMMAWAQAYAERGELDKARYLAQRMKEFSNPQSAEYFAECERAAAVGVKPPYQCELPARRFSFEDFR